MLEMVRHHTSRHIDPRTVVNLDTAGVVVPSAEPKGYVRVNYGIDYVLLPGRRNWTGLDVLFSTWGAAAEGQLTLNVYGEAEGGNCLRKAVADLRVAPANDWLSFRFPPISNSAGQKFRLEFVLSGTSRKGKVVFYESSPLRRGYLRLLRRVGFRLPGNSLYCRMWYDDEG
jgi:hypothetical protein